MKKILSILAVVILTISLLPGPSAFASTEAQLSKNNSTTLHDGDHATADDYPYVAQKMDVTNRTVTSFSFWLTRQGTPTGNLYFDIWQYGADEDIGTILYSQLATSDLTDISTGGALYTVTLDSPVWLNGTYRIGLTCTSSTGSNQEIKVSFQSTDVKANEYLQTYHVFASEWEGDASYGDLYYSYEYTSGGGAPTVETNIAVGNSISGEMSLNGVVTLIGSATVTLTGVQWGTSTGNYTNTQNSSGLTITDNSTGFEETISGLVNNTTYYWRALAENSAGVGYGAEETFVMGTVPTLHITRAWMEASGTDLEASAVIDDDAGATITSAGVYFDTTSGGTSIHRQPTTVPVEDEEWSVIASSEGTLNTRYYARAYAVTSAGTAYSAEAMFIAGKSEYVYNDSGTGVDIILPVTTAINNSLTSVGMNNSAGKALGAFLIIAFVWFWFRKKKPLNIVMPVGAFAVCLAIGWIEIWIVIVGAALIGAILYFTVGRRSTANA